MTLPLIPLISDPHMHPWREFSRLTDDGVNDRMVDTLLAWRQLRALMVRLGLDFAICGGDVFHKRGYIHTQAFNLMHRELAAFKRKKKRVIAIPGNHDQDLRDGSEHALEALRDVATIYSEPAVEVIGNILFQFVPFMEDVTEIRRAIKPTPFRPKSVTRHILIAHLGVNGAVTGNYEYTPHEQIDVEDFSLTYDAVFLGHYHRRQWLRRRSSGSPVGYIGTPTQQTRGEASEQDKGLLLVDPRTMRVEVVKTNAPVFKTVTNEQIAWLAQEGTDASSVVASKIKGNFIDATVERLPPSLDSLEAVKRLLLRHGARGAEAYFIEEPVADRRERLEVDTSMSLPQMVPPYVRRYAPEGASYDALIRTGQALLQESSDDE